MRVGSLDVSHFRVGLDTHAEGVACYVSCFFRPVGCARYRDDTKAMMYEV